MLSSERAACLCRRSLFRKPGLPGRSRIRKARCRTTATETIIFVRQAGGSDSDETIRVRIARIELRLIVAGEASPCRRDRVDQR